MKAAIWDLLHDESGLASIEVSALILAMAAFLTFTYNQKILVSVSNIIALIQTKIEASFIVF